MEIYKDTIKCEYYTNTILDKYLGGMSFCVFDIETLGLNPQKAPVVLAGFMEVDSDGNALITQYFLDKPEEEPLLVDRIIEKLNDFDFIITFNGKHFDLPYIEKRLKILNHRPMDLHPYNLDIYLMLYGHSSLKHVLGNLKQKTVEKYMGLGLDREDEISGAESVELYLEYMFEEDVSIKERLKNKILLHNHDDVAQLYKLLPVLRQCDIHKAMYKLGFPVLKGSNESLSFIPDMLVKNIRLTGSKLSVSGTYYGESTTYIAFPTEERNFEFSLERDKQFFLTVPVIKESGAVYINLLDYFTSIKDFEMLGGFINNYLILSEGTAINYQEVNSFILELLKTM